MPSNTGHYDQNLLAAAPVATRAQLQEGYTTDLLDPNHGKATPPHSASQADPERGLVHKEYAGHVTSRAQPFWRTRKGMIIIFIVAVVIVAAVIGGAVGGTAGKKQATGSPSQGQDSGQGTGQQGSGQENPVGTGATTNQSASTNPTSQPASQTTITTTPSPSPTTDTLGQGGPTPIFNEINPTGPFQGDLSTGLKS